MNALESIGNLPSEWQVVVGVAIGTVLSWAGFAVSEWWDRR